MHLFLITFASDINDRPVTLTGDIKITEKVKFKNVIMFK